MNKPVTELYAKTTELAEVAETLETIRQTIVAALSKIKSMSCVTLSMSAVPQLQAGNTPSPAHTAKRNSKGEPDRLSEAEVEAAAIYCTRNGVLPAWLPVCSSLDRKKIHSRVYSRKQSKRKKASEVQRKRRAAEKKAKEEKALGASRNAREKQTAEARTPDRAQASTATRSIVHKLKDDNTMDPRSFLGALIGSDDESLTRTPATRRITYKFLLHSISETHGPDVAGYVSAHMLNGDRTAAKLKDAFGTYLGRYPTRSEAGAAFANVHGLPARTEGDALRALQTQAKFQMRHADGATSVWSIRVDAPPAAEPKPEPKADAAATEPDKEPEAAAQ